MKRYRILAISPGRPAEQVLDMTCVDEGDVLIRCHTILSEHHCVEAWDGHRLVCRMQKTGTPHSKEDKRR